LDRLLDLFSRKKVLRMRVLILFLILIYIPMALYMYFVYTKTVNVVKEEKIKAVNQILIKTSQSIDLTLTGIEEGAYEIASQNGIRKGLQDFQGLPDNAQEKILHFIEEKFQNLKTENPYIYQFLCITEEGIVISSSEDLTINMDHFIKSDIYKAMSGSRENLFWWYIPASPVFQSTHMGEKLFFLAQKIRPVWEEGNVGYLFTFINIEGFKALYRDASFGITGGLDIYDDNKKLALSQSDYTISKDLFDSLVRGEKFYKMREISMNNNQFLVGIAPLNTVGWYLKAIVPKKELTETIEINLKKSFWLIAFISIFLTLWIVIEVIILSRVVTEKEMAHYRLVLSEEMNEKLRMYKHDFMNHLQIIRGLIELEYSDKALEYLKMVAKEGMVLRSKYEIGIAELESTIFTAISKAREKNIDVEIDCIKLSENLPVKVYDLTKILSNLIKNAMYALENSEDEDKKLKIKIYEELDDYVFEVTNNVPLIPEDIRDKIFKRGFTTKGQEGNGLGLYIVKKMVRKNNGTIELKVDKEGNHFIVRFPLSFR